MNFHSIFEKLLTINKLLPFLRVLFDVMDQIHAWVPNVRLVKRWDFRKLLESHPNGLGDPRGNFFLSFKLLEFCKLVHLYLLFIYILLVNLENVLFLCKRTFDEKFNLSHVNFYLTFELFVGK